MKRILFLSFLLNFSLVSISCGGNMNELLTKSSFSEKWNAMKMNSSEFWWYAGSKKNLHFIAIETPFNTNIYSIKNTTIKFKGISKKEYSSKKSSWTIIKIENIEVMR